MKNLKVIMMVMLFVVSLISSPGLFSEENIVKSVKKSDSISKCSLTHTCPMASCKTFSDKEGKCPKCGMALVKIEKKKCDGKSHKKHWKGNKGNKNCCAKKAQKNCDAKKGNRNCCAKKVNKDCKGKKGSYHKNLNKKNITDKTSSSK